MKTFFKPIPFITLILLNFFFLPNCGKKGPLKLDPVVSPERISDFSVIQVGDNLRFTWKFPDLLKDKKTKFDINNVKKMYFFYSVKSVTSGSIRKRGALLKKINLNKIPSDKDKYVFLYPAISSKFSEKKIYIAMYYKYKRITSEMTDIKEITIHNPVEPIKKLVITNENKVIKLDWERRDTTKDKKRNVQILGYNIFRKISKSGEEMDSQFQKLNKDIVLDEHYEDSDAGTSGIYTYYVSVILTNSNISERSNIEKVIVNDIFPPEVPKNIIIFKSEKGLMISWESVKDNDLSHYTLYRKEESELDFNILVLKIENNNYLDKSVEKGKVYLYYVTSTDKNGNESDNSKIASDKT